MKNCKVCNEPNNVESLSGLCPACVNEMADAYSEGGTGGLDDDEPEDYFDDDDGMSDVEADADTLRCAGWGTDEDYGLYDDGDGW